MRRAIALLGLDGVRAAAAGLRAWPGPLAESAAATLQRLIGEVRLAGHLAQRIRPAGYDAEVVFLLAALQNLGRLMLYYHFAEDAQQIAQLMRAPASASTEPAESIKSATRAAVIADANRGRERARVESVAGAAMVLRRVNADRATRV